MATTLKGGAREPRQSRRRCFVDRERGFGYPAGLRLMSRERTSNGPFDQLF